MASRPATAPPARKDPTAAAAARKAAAAALWTTLPMSQLPQSGFDASTTAAEVIARFAADPAWLAQWTGRRILITGVSPDGIGEETLRAFARLPGVELYATARTPAKSAS